MTTNHPTDPYAHIAAWYDLEHDAISDDIECYSELLASLQDNRTAILEIGSGSGRIAAGLAAAGYEVTGIEPSLAMRTRCEGRLEQLPQRVAHRVHLVVGSANEMNIATTQRFHAVLYGLNTFAHLTDRAQRQEALALAKAHLLPEGLLLIDLDLAGPRRLLGTTGQLYLQGTWQAPDKEQWVSHLIAALPGATPGMISVTHFYDVFRSGAAVERTLSQMQLALLSYGELEVTLTSAGFEVVGSYGGYDLAPYDELSPRVIVVAKPSEL